MSKAQLVITAVVLEGRSKKKSPGSTRVKDNNYAAIGERWLSR